MKGRGYALAAFVVMLAFAVVNAALGNDLVMHIYLAAMLASLGTIGGQEYTCERTNHGTCRPERRRADGERKTHAHDRASLRD